MNRTPTELIPGRDERQRYLLSIASGRGPAMQSIVRQVNAVADIDNDEYGSILLEWIEQGIAYPITEEERHEAGFCTQQEVEHLFGITAQEEDLKKVNSMAYCIFCALRHVGARISHTIHTPLMEYRRDIIKCSLIMRGLFPAGHAAWDPVPGEANPENPARSRVFTTTLIPHPIDSQSARVSGLDKI